jgi:hypothetical protein
MNLVTFFLLDYYHFLLLDQPHIALDQLIDISVSYRVTHFRSTLWTSAIGTHALSSTFTAICVIIGAYQLRLTSVYVIVLHAD